MPRPTTTRRRTGSARKAQELSRPARAVFLPRPGCKAGMGEGDRERPALKQRRGSASKAREAVEGESHEEKSRAQRREQRTLNRKDAKAPRFLYVSLQRSSRACAQVAKRLHPPRYPFASWRLGGSFLPLLRLMTFPFHRCASLAVPLPHLASRDGGGNAQHPLRQRLRGACTGEANKRPAGQVDVLTPTLRRTQSVGASST